MAYSQVRRLAIARFPWRAGCRRCTGLPVHKLVRVVSPHCPLVSSVPGRQAWRAGVDKT